MQQNLNALYMITCPLQKQNLWSLSAKIALFSGCGKDSRFCRNLTARDFYESQEVRARCEKLIKVLRQTV
jgi:hypothetical protein